MSAEECTQCTVTKSHQYVALSRRIIAILAVTLLQNGNTVGVKFGAPKESNGTAPSSDTAMDPTPSDSSASTSTSRLDGTASPGMPNGTNFRFLLTVTIDCAATNDDMYLQVRLVRSKDPRPAARIHLVPCPARSYRSSV